MTPALPPDFGPPLNRSSPIPLWVQVEDRMRGAIADGRLAPGQRLEPEAQLCRRFSVSRPTLRQALAGLRRRGLVDGRPGSGTFVTGSSTTAVGAAPAHQATPT